MSDRNPAAPPSAGEFAKTIWDNMFSLLSGGLTVPLMVAGYWIGNEAARWGLMATAFVCAWYAGYLIWADERRRVIELDPPLPERISLVELAKIAEIEHGWNFASGWEALDLFTELRSAANDGLLQLQGKQVDHWGSPPVDEWRRAQLLFRDIQRGDWDKWHLGFHAPLIQPLTIDDNFEILVTSVLDNAPRYYDPHLTDRAKAVRWLKQHAGKNRGLSERSHREEEAKRLNRALTKG